MSSLAYFNPKKCFYVFADGLVDILMRKGKENYKKFLQVVGIFHPDVYTEITGNDPPDAKSMNYIAHLEILF